MVKRSGMATAIEPDHMANAVAHRVRPAGVKRLKALLVTALYCGLAAGALQPVQAQTSGALPIYRCVSADGTSSRISRTPCTAGESGTTQHAAAGTQKQQPAIAHQTPATPAQSSQASSSAEEPRSRPRSRSGRRR
ncbi:hypothetical protein DZC30_17485 [Comamonas testosteroni]|uniref:Uncharacterized protein n=1 Tax=Comamonas testosteroni TaxID=285 RepID=A0A373FFB2_COMTE|nr:hypothetical protein DZC30_17485 [Comamonas testosteroni]